MIVSAETKPAASVCLKMIKNVTEHFAKFGKLEIKQFYTDIKSWAILDLNHSEYSIQFYIYSSKACEQMLSLL
jgi:hypothetical protein